MAKVLGLTLPLRVGSNGYFESTTDILTQVKADLTNLLLTQRGERIMQPTFGCDIPAQLFEPNTVDGLANVTAVVKTAVQQWMPFLTVNGVSVTQDVNTNSTTVSVSFTIANNNITDSVVLVF